LADDKLSDLEIAARVGINDATLWRWKKQAAFAARVQAIRDEYAAAVVAEGIRDRRNRVASQNERWQRLHRVIEDRAKENPTEGLDWMPGFDKPIPGYDTGLLVKQWKMIGQGRGARMVLEVSVDTALLGELRALEKHAAQELSQWDEGKGESSGGTTVIVLESPVGLRLPPSPMQALGMPDVIEVERGSDGDG
jgi:hypothetical protein